VLGVVWTYFLVFAENPIVMKESFFVKPPFYPIRSLLSLRHFGDMANLVLQGIPGILCVLPLFILAGQRSVFQHDAVRFTAIGTAAFLGASFLIHPLLDFPADWDLFTMFQVFGNLFLFELLLRMDADSRADLVSFLPGVAIVCIFATAFWIARNHASTDESRRTVELALRNSKQFLQTIRDDRVYAAVPRDRKKVAVQVKLFLLGAENKLRDRTDHREMLEQVVRERKEFDLYVLLPEDEYLAQRQAIFDRLTDLNLRVSELGP